MIERTNPTVVEAVQAKLRTLDQSIKSLEGQIDDGLKKYFANLEALAQLREKKAAITEWLVLNARPD